MHCKYTPHYFHNYRVEFFLIKKRVKSIILRYATACGISPRLRLDLVLNDFVTCAIKKREIEILSDEKATGIWAMFDYVRLPTCNFKGWGHYHEVYVRSSEGWKIEKIHLTRLHTEEEWV